MTEVGVLFVRNLIRLMLNTIANSAQSSGTVYSESRGGLPGLPVPSKPDGFCGRKATQKQNKSNLACASGRYPFSSVNGISVRSEKRVIMRSTPSLSFPNVAFETVPVFVWLTMVLTRPFKEDRLALLLRAGLA